jgi:hypothetical protein
MTAPVSPDDAAARALLEPLVEMAARDVHDAYLRTTTQCGWPIKPELNTPFDKLPKTAQELDRATARAALLSAPVLAATAALVEERDGLVQATDLNLRIMRKLEERAIAAEASLAALRERAAEDTEMFDYILGQVDGRRHGPPNFDWIRERQAKVAHPASPDTKVTEAEPVLPCSVTLGNYTFNKGVKMSVLQGKLTRMYQRYAGLSRHWAERSVNTLPPIEETDDAI